MLSDADRADQMGQATREKIRQFVARIERLQAEKDKLSADMREVYAEVKTFGLDVKIMKKVIADRKMDAAEKAEQEALLDLYLDAVEDSFSYESQTPAASKSKAILMNMDGSREEIMVEMLLTNLMHNGKFYAHYTQNAYKQV